MDEEALVLPNVILTLTGPDGREWMAGAYMGTLNCITPGTGEELPVEGLEHKDFHIKKFTVVQRA